MWICFRGCWGEPGAEGFYVGEWPSGHVYCGDFLHHPKELMFKLLADLTEAEKADLERSVESDKQFMERQMNAFSQES